MELRRLRRAETAGVGHYGGGERKSEETGERGWDQSDDIYLEEIQSKGICWSVDQKRGDLLQGAVLVG